jgi:hypothetical protein
LLDSWEKDILLTVTEHARCVDANALCFLWPREFNKTRVCVVSGPITRPIFSCYCAPHASQNVEALSDVILRCDNNHFSILVPAKPSKGGKEKVLSSMLRDAADAHLCVQLNEVEEPRQAISKAVAEILH